MCSIHEPGSADKLTIDLFLQILTCQIGIKSFHSGVPNKQQVHSEMINYTERVPFQRAVVRFITLLGFPFVLFTRGLCYCVQLHSYCCNHTGVVAYFIKSLSQGAAIFDAIRQGWPFCMAQQKMYSPQKWVHSIVMLGVKLRSTCSNEKIGNCSITYIIARNTK